MDETDFPSKSMCTRTRPRFILSSERVGGGVVMVESKPMLTPREISPLQ